MPSMCSLNFLVLLITFSQVYLILTKLKIPQRQVLCFITSFLPQYQIACLTNPEIWNLLLLQHFQSFALRSANVHIESRCHRDRAVVTWLPQEKKKIFCVVGMLVLGYYHMYVSHCHKHRPI